MHILIIGGTGLISTGITRLLLERGDKVTLYNRGQHEATISGTRQIVGDRKDYTTFEAQMAEAGTFDAVIDMVAFIPAEVESAIRAFKGRTMQYVFCSTVDVYTKPATRYPVTENTERKPRTSFPYALHKAQCEFILEAAHARGDFAVTIIRPAWTYGEGGAILHPLGWNSYFLDRLRKGKPLIVPGDGTSFWVACHRDDVAQAFVGALGNAKAFGKSYHATGEEWLTWDAYHHIVAEVLGAPTPTLVHIPTDLLDKVAPKTAEWCVENFHFNNIFDNTAARADLGFAYNIPFAGGARRVIVWQETHAGFANSDDFPFYDAILEAWTRLGNQMVEQFKTLNL